MGYNLLYTRDTRLIEAADRSWGFDTAAEVVVAEVDVDCRQVGICCADSDYDRLWS
jgi:hypothetical protein